MYLSHIPQCTIQNRNVHRRIQNTQHNATLFKPHSSPINGMGVFLLIPYKFNLGCHCVVCFIYIRPRHTDNL